MISAQTNGSTSVHKNQGVESGDIWRVISGGRYLGAISGGRYLAGDIWWAISCELYLGVDIWWVISSSRYLAFDIWLVISGERYLAVPSVLLAWIWSGHRADLRSLL